MATHPLPVGNGFSHGSREGEEEEPAMVGARERRSSCGCGRSEVDRCWSSSSVEELSGGRCCVAVE